MKWIVLTPEQAAKYRQYKITPWWGIDPIKTKNGLWVLRADQINEIEDFKIIIQQQKIKPQQIASQISRANVPIDELKTIKNIVELTKDDFPEAKDGFLEEEIIDNKIKK